MKRFTLHTAILFVVLRKERNKMESIKSIDSFGNQFWRNENGKLHRDDDMPAVIYWNGSKSWFKNGEYHRDGNLPAYIGSDGTQAWWKNGLRHRDEDLPAVIHADGKQEWWKEGKREK